MFTKAIAGKLLYKMAENEKNITLQATLLNWSKNDDVIQMLHKKALAEKRTIQYQTVLDFVYLCDHNSIPISKLELEEIKSHLPQYAAK